MVIHIWVNQKIKKPDWIWSAGAKPERKERFFSTQLISQESPVVEINYLEGNGPEWLIHKGLLLILTESRILWKREGINLLVHVCRSNSPSIFFLVVFFSFFPLHSFLFYFKVYFFEFLFLSYGSRCCSIFCSRQGSLFIVLAVIKFYCFSP